MEDTQYYHGNKFPIGSVVYFVEHEGYKGKVNWGIVSENRTHEIYAELLDIKYFGANVDGIPMEEFETPTKWKKLPKGWSYDTRLFNWDKGTPDEHLKHLDPRKPEDILEAYHNGWLVEKQHVDYSIIRAEIDKKYGWRIIREHPRNKYIFTNVHLPAEKFYKTYEEADAVVQAELAEFNRQTALTDDEWSIEQIEHNLQRWKVLFNVDDSQVDAAREMLLSLDNIFDVETRIANGGLEWKRVKNKRWGGVIV